MNPGLDFVPAVVSEQASDVIYMGVKIFLMPRRRQFRVADYAVASLLTAQSPWGQPGVGSCKKNHQLLRSRKCEFLLVSSHYKDASQVMYQGPPCWTLCAWR